MGSAPDTVPITVSIRVSARAAGAMPTINVAVVAIASPKVTPRMFLESAMVLTCLV
jgi:hypothetical protein